MAGGVIIAIIATNTAQPNTAQEKGYNNQPTQFCIASRRGKQPQNVFLCRSHPRRQLVLVDAPELLLAAAAAAAGAWNYIFDVDLILRVVAGVMAMVGVVGSVPAGKLGKRSIEREPD